ncbi:two-component system sensor histidine kinase VicK [Pontibacter aydingkolensis]|uniref:histidine kinase n=1 Tax=Pontibacter aydingkolensis TaxID=1911536 RepID=A0ABS7CUY7_9BACT|nr:PAS domain-containing sensor histidine kinase [Pontibacter aydingkolensis]MBW7467578.1 PAS domain-containing sensor histidine kinase [Pontibacter aydingkolensis]
MEESSGYEIFKKLIRRTNKVLFAYDTETASVSFLNEAFNLIWNRTRESIIAKPSLLLDTVHPEDKDYITKEYQELLSGILKKDIEFRIVLPDKSFRWLLLNPQLITDRDGKQYIAGLVEDITVLKDDIRNLEKFAAKKNSVLEILSHDLAGPLANIQALAGFLSESTKEYKNEEVKNIIRIIGESSARSIHLIRDFVQQEFLESSNAGLVKRRVNLVSKIGEIIEQYKEGEDHISKRFTLTTSGSRMYAYIDQSKFMQVINNLISNAIKFTHDNGEIDTEIADNDGKILITIRDNGIGIPERYHDELFDKFTKARRQGLRGEPSTGLGMSIIKTIVEWHEGSIWFESAENKGTTFYIEIPKG